MGHTHTHAREEILMIFFTNTCIPTSFNIGHNTQGIIIFILQLRKLGLKESELIDP